MVGPMRRAPALLLVALALSACLTKAFSFDSTHDSTLTITFGQLGGPCEGTTTHRDDHGVVTLSKTTDTAAGTCRVRILFRARLLDMTQVREEVAAKVIARGHVPDRVTIRRISTDSTLLIHSIQLSGVDGASSPWRGDLEVDGIELATLSGADLASLADTTLSVQLHEELAARVLEAYESADELEASGVVELAAIPLAQWHALEPEREVSIDFAITAELSVDAEYEL